jgi:hypothetical protein
MDKFDYNNFHPDQVVKGLVELIQVIKIIKGLIEYLELETTGKKYAFYSEKPAARHRCLWTF